LASFPCCRAPPPAQLLVRPRSSSAAASSPFGTATPPLLVYDNSSYLAKPSCSRPNDPLLTVLLDCLLNAGSQNGFKFSGFRFSGWTWFYFNSGAILRVETGFKIFWVLVFGFLSYRTLEMGKTSELIEYFIHLWINPRTLQYMVGIKVISIFKTRFINKYYKKSSELDDRMFNESKKK